MTALDRITSMTTAEPEQRFCAAMLADAMEACRAGCGESCAWLQTVGLDYLLLITPADRNVDELAARLCPTSNRRKENQHER